MTAQAELVPVVASSFDLPVLCGECPAIAEVLHVERCVVSDSLIAVVRCHGQVFFLEVSGRMVRRRSKLLLEDLLPGLTVEEMLKAIADREETAEHALRAAAFYRDAIIKSGITLDGDQDKRDKYTVLAELLMNLAELYK